MSSPPPLPPPVIPQKRPSIAGSQTSTASKRRHTTHPLRQTSFPAADATPFTPSDAGSVVSAAAESVVGVGGIGRKRGRPKKNAPGQNRTVGDGTGTITELVGGSRKSLGARGGRAGEQGDGAGSLVDGGEDDDEGDEYAGLEPDQIEAMNSEEVFKKQAEDQAKLQQALNPIQSDRFSVFKRTKFSPKTLKRIVNQVVSQSVTPTPLLAMNLALKWFTGEIVEQAVRVQDEMALKWELGLLKRLQREELEEQEKESKKKTEKRTIDGQDAPDPSSNQENDIKTADTTNNNNDHSPTSTLPISSSSVPPSPPPQRRPRPPPPPNTTLSGHENPHRGGLLPEHLFEAIRRYRATEGHGGVGFGGLSMVGQGVKGGKTWAVEEVGVAGGRGRGAHGGEVVGGRLFR